MVDRARRRGRRQGRRPGALRSRPLGAPGRAAGPRRGNAGQPAGPAQDQPDRRARARHSRRVSQCRAGRGRDSRCSQARRPNGPARARPADHRPHRRPRSRRRRARRARRRSRQRRRLDRARGDRRRRPLRALRHAPRPRGAGARQLGLLPRSRRADAAGEDFQRPVLAARGRRPPLPRRAHDLRPPRQQEAPHVPARHDALGRQAVLRGGAGRHRRPSERQGRAAAGTARSSRCGPPTPRWRPRATGASRSISIFPSARS